MWVQRKFLKTLQKMDAVRPNCDLKQKYATESDQRNKAVLIMVRTCYVDDFSQPQHSRDLMKNILHGK